MFTYFVYLSFARLANAICSGEWHDALVTLGGFVSFSHSVVCVAVFIAPLFRCSVICIRNVKQFLFFCIMRIVLGNVL